MLVNNCRDNPSIKCYILILALRVVFGSLYDNEIILNPLSIVPIIATATMFQLETLIEKCTEVMLETINPKVSIFLKILLFIFI